LAADGDLDDLLHVGNLDAVARDPLAVDLDLQVRFADDAVGKHRRGLYGRDLLQQAFEFEPEPLDRFEVRAVDLDAHRRPESGLEHDDAGLNRLELRRAGDARHVGRFHDGVPDVLRTLNLITPLAERLTVLVLDESSLIVANESAGIIDLE